MIIELKGVDHLKGPRTNVFSLLENCRVKKEFAGGKKKVGVFPQSHTVHAVPCGYAAKHSMEFKNSDNIKIWLQCVRSSLYQLYPDCLRKSL